jgi:hypothetical protein
MPFLPEPLVETVEEKKSNDPWARIKEAKTREERKKLFAEILASKKSKSSNE